MATGREFLDSIISRCAEMQNWSDADLELNKGDLKEADDLLDRTTTEDELEKEEQAESERMRDEEIDANLQRGSNFKQLTVVTEFDEEMIPGEAKLSVTYYLEGYWAIEGGTPSGWVNFELTNGETKPAVRDHLLRCGFSAEQVDHILEDF